MRTCLLAILLLVAACDSASPSKVDEARALWAETKADCRTYHYTVASDLFPASRSTTSFEFVDDVATARMYVRLEPGSPPREPAVVVAEAWVETGAEVGSHPDNDPGMARPRTMEQLYDSCANDVLPEDPKENAISFSVDERGVLRSCLSVRLHCGDACTTGFELTDFGCGPLDRTLPRS